MKKTIIMLLLSIFSFFLILDPAHSSLAGSDKKAKNKVTYEKIAKALKYQKLNINTADVVTLAKVKGIGSMLARSIIDHRNKSGKFKNIAQLKRVKGFDDTIYTQIAPMVTVN